MIIIAVLFITPFVKLTLLETFRFLLLDAIHKRRLCRRAVSVRLTVRLSVTLVYSIKASEHIFMSTRNCLSPLTSGRNLGNRTTGTEINFV